MVEKPWCNQAKKFLWDKKTPNLIPVGVLLKIKGSKLELVRPKNSPGLQF